MRRAFSVVAAFGCLAFVGAAWSDAEARPKYDESLWKTAFHELDDGTKLHYAEMGEGTPVILIHGAGGSAVGNWFRNGIAPALSRTNRVIGIDMRGHGMTESPTEGGFEKMPTDVIEFMKDKGIEKAHIGGYSMGGFVTLSIMTSNPELFITASYQGSGITEKEEFQNLIPADKAGEAPMEAKAREAYYAARAARGEEGWAISAHVPQGATLGPIPRGQKRHAGGSAPRRPSI